MEEYKEIRQNVRRQKRGMEFYGDQEIKDWIKKQNRKEKKEGRKNKVLRKKVSREGTKDRKTRSERCKIERNGWRRTEVLKGTKDEKDERKRNKWKKEI